MNKWYKIQLIMIQWVIFAMLLSVVSMWFLLKDRKATQSKLQTCEKNWEIVSKQIESGRIILDLK